VTANGDMLRLARQRRGCQQTEAARALGIDQSLLSRYENGLLDVRDDLLLKAAQIYDFPQTFFRQRVPVYGAPVSVHAMWRRKADISARELDRVIAELNIRVMHLRRLFEGAEIANTSNLPRMDIDEYGDPERIAAMLRAHWQVPPGPIKNLTLLVEKSGVLVCLSRLGGTSISGVTFATPGMPPLVALNSAQPADRRRFTLAHELAHLVMHRFPTPDMEREANAFAVEVLMPAADIRPYFVGRRIELSTLAALKPEWKVSIAALLMRAHALKFITESQYRYLWKQISARGYRLREPPELDFEPECPEVLDQLIKLHLDGLGYSLSELARMLCVHEHELRDLYEMDELGGANKAKLTVLK
jgi:Zn-dependent peptidase ImmA (M78 family)/transcriptional regulator with XRE-family HTH domain